MPNCVWVLDITYLKVNGRHAYLCVIIDLFSRSVVS
ncbi:DDE-type integrase/transposase/recombinase [Anaerococcus porci]